MRYIVLMILIPLTLAACSNKGLRELSTNSAGPDEFMIQPVKPLEQPPSFDQLPTPTPGQANAADRSALAEGIVAFGGRPEAANAGIPASDGALVNHARRKGVDPNIRADLAEKDAKFRKRKERFTQFRIAYVDRYDKVYKREKLNAESEAARWRRAGARTPSAPPADR